MGYSSWYNWVDLQLITLSDLQAALTSQFVARPVRPTMVDSTKRYRSPNPSSCLPHDITELCTAIDDLSRYLKELNYLYGLSGDTAKDYLLGHLLKPISSPKIPKVIEVTVFPMDENIDEQNIQCQLAERNLHFYHSSTQDRQDPRCDLRYSFESPPYIDRSVKISTLSYAILVFKSSPLIVPSVPPLVLLLLMLWEWADCRKLPDWQVPKKDAITIAQDIFDLTADLAEGPKRLPNIEDAQWLPLWFRNQGIRHTLEFFKEKISFSGRMNSSYCICWNRMSLLDPLTMMDIREGFGGWPDKYRRVDAILEDVAWAFGYSGGEDMERDLRSR
ncbi:hypothetical protein AAF712_010534 [Marasmius tenuissimus]|uniref:Uncharacterized protein n=1 Tax=Marasmius tenuissimus TaxID=585030 RepID=A0ABR2ZMW8_9AGAR